MKKIIILSSLVVLFGCKKGFLDINQNPNNATSATPELILPNALNQAAARTVNSYAFISGWMGQWAVSGSYAPSSSDFATYKQTTDFGQGLWSSIYNNLEDLNFIEQSALVQFKPFYSATAKIMKAFEFHQLVDMFNDIPYSEALQGIGNLTPKYDDAQSVYESLIANIDSAVLLLQDPQASVDATNVGIGGYDIMFKGNIPKWTQFANTLKLRLLMRQSQMPGQASYIQQEIAKIVDNGAGFLTDDASVNPGYLNSTGKTNPFWGLNYNVVGTYINDYWRANQYAILFYRNNNDQRYKRIYASTAPVQGVNDDNYRGNYLGGGGFSGSTSSAFGSGVLTGFSQSAIIFSAVESYSLQAEATIRGWLNGGDDATAKSLYERGVHASFVTYGVPLNIDGSDQETALLNSGNKNYDWAVTTDFNSKLALIIRQKWAGLNTVTPFEPWCDYRRLGLPADIPLTQSPYADVYQIPSSIIYPQSEYNTNGQNVPQQPTNAQFTQKIFWMP